MRVIGFILANLMFVGVAWGQITTVRGEDEDEFKRTIRTDTEGRLQTVQAQSLLDSCDATTDWAALNSDTTGLATSTDHVQGVASLEFDKVDGAANTVYGGIDKTLTAIDIGQYMANGGFIFMSLNVSSLADIEYCFIRLGTDSSNYSEWRADDDDLTTGWQQISYPFYLPSSAGSTGDGINPGSVTYIAVGCAFDNESDTLANIRVDNLAVNSVMQSSVIVSSIVTMPSNPVYVHNTDGTNLAYIAPSTADDLSKAENGIKVEAVAKYDDGAGLDTGKVGSAGEILMTDVATRPGENVGLNAREVKVSYLGVSEPVKTDPTAVDDTAISATTGIIILGPVKTLPDGRFCIYVKNAGGGSGDDFADVEIHDSPDGSSGWVTTNTWTSCDTLTAGSDLCKYCSDESMGWIQVKAKCGAGDDTTAEAWLKQVRR